MSDYSLIISADDLSDLLAAADVRVMDCRFNLFRPDEGRELYAAGHIPGAIYADLERDLSGPVQDGTGRHPLPDPVRLAETFGRAGIGSRTQVVVYDDAAGAIAARAWWLLRWLGHRRVAVLDGGLAAWTRSGGALDAGAVEAPCEQFAGRPQPGRVIETDELQSRLSGAGEDLYLIDARDAARYRGDQEPIDPVAGRIPGALNLPYARLVGPDGRFRASSEIRRVWDEVLGKPGETECAVMCGSGVTACHLVLAALLAEKSEPRLYAGSWSEWIRDPSRPIERGPRGGPG